MVWPLDVLRRDAKAAVRWIKANAAEWSVHKDYITAYGDSAGSATVVALGMLDEDDYKSEMTVEEDPTLASTNLAQSSTVATVLDHWGTDWMSRQLWVRGNGRSRYSASDAPLAIFHGTADKAVPFALETGRLLAGYNATGRPYAFFPIQGAGHGAWGSPCGQPKCPVGLKSCLGPACGDLMQTPAAPTTNWEDEIGFRFVVQQQNLTLLPCGRGQR